MSNPCSIPRIKALLDHWSPTKGKAILLVLGLITAAPFLNPIHTRPIPSFYSEWISTALGLGVVALSLPLLSRRREIVFPLLAWVPWALAAIVAIREGVSSPTAPNHAHIYALILLLSGLLVVAGALFAEEFSTERLTRAVAAGWVIGAALQATVMLTQYWGWVPPFGVAALQLPSPVPVGLIGQTNHLVHYLWLGNISALYLYWRQRVSLLSFVAILLALSGISVLPAARSAFLYPLGIGIGLWIIGAQIKCIRQARTGLLFFALIPFMLAIDALADRSSNDYAKHTQTVVQRFAELPHDTTRITLLKAAGIAVLDQPWIGHGIESTRRLSFMYSQQSGRGAPTIVAEHFHNLPAQLAIEFGVPIATLVVALLAYSLFRMYRTDELNEEKLWMAGLLMVVGFHSLLEYPLWLAYFLIPISFLLGVFSAASKKREVGPILTITMLTAVTLGVATLAMAWKHYRTVEALYAATERSESHPETLIPILAGGILQSRTSLFAPEAVLLVVDLMRLSRYGNEEKREYCKKALHISPSEERLFKCAATFGLLGDRIAATSHLTALALAYDWPHGKYEKKWRQLQSEFAELGAIPWPRTQN